MFVCGPGHCEVVPDDEMEVLDRAMEYERRRVHRERAKRRQQGIPEGEWPWPCITDESMLAAMDLVGNGDFLWQSFGLRWDDRLSVLDGIDA
jgi:hypothetical protein